MSNKSYPLDELASVAPCETGDVTPPQRLCSHSVSELGLWSSSVLFPRLTMVFEKCLCDIGHVRYNVELVWLLNVSEVCI